MLAKTFVKRRKDVVFALLEILISETFLQLFCGYVAVAIAPAVVLAMAMSYLALYFARQIMRGLRVS